MRKLFCLVLLSSTLMLQSCFEIIEQLVMKADGSGNLQLVLNMSKSKTRLNAIMKMKTANGHKVPDENEIRQKLADLEKDIKTTPGISNVKTVLDFENFIATLTCDFTNVNSLNTCTRNLAEKSKNKKPVENSFEYDIIGKTFTRINKFLVKDEYDKMSNADKEIFATANYTNIFRFDTEVISASNKDSKIAANKKAVMLKLNVLDIISNKKSIENKIKLK
ncbi:MAG: hypothetical protein ABI402_10480 [Ferruginibacter sp.]